MSLEDVLADLNHAVRWIEGEISHRRPALEVADGRSIDTLLSSLRAGDLPNLRNLIAAELFERDRKPRPLRPGAFVSRLTEAELLARLSNVFRYRILSNEETAKSGYSTRDELVLELDPHWHDPDFPTVERPTPQELWDELLEESRTTPVLALSEKVPNALDRKRSDEPELRWIDVHADQPIIFVERPVKLPLAEGFVRVHQPGDDALMERKRKFSALAEAHPALEDLLEFPPSVERFVENSGTRLGLEDEILATRGIFAVQGPPGTGKTYLATQVVRRFLAQTPGARVLVCAKEHFALDNILRTITKGLIADGVAFRAFARSLSRKEEEREQNSTRRGSATESLGTLPNATGLTKPEAGASGRRPRPINMTVGCFPLLKSRRTSSSAPLSMHLRLRFSAQSPSISSSLKRRVSATRPSCCMRSVWVEPL
jgi:hypothetical protein